MCPPEPLTEGFDAPAEQLLHRAALVQVQSARHGRQRGVGWAQTALREPPTGLGPNPCPGRGRSGVCGGAGGGAAPRAETGRGGHAPCWAGAELSAAATPGVKRSGPGWCNPPVGKWTRGQASGPPSESREGRGASRGRGSQDPRTGWRPAPAGSLLLASSPQRHLQHPAARLCAPPASLPPQPPFPRRVILGTRSLRGPRRNFSLVWEGGGENPGVLPASPLPERPGRQGGAAVAPRGLP